QETLRALGYVDSGQAATPPAAAPQPYDVRNVRQTDLAQRDALQHEAPGALADRKKPSSEGATLGAIGRQLAAAKPAAAGGEAAAEKAVGSAAPSEAAPSEAAPSEAAPPASGTPAPQSGAPQPLMAKGGRSLAKTTLGRVADEVREHDKRADEPLPAPEL